jgi:putative phosphoesterase
VRIGLVSDTHVPQAVSKLPVEVERALDGVDLILHAGDIFESSALDQLERIAPVLAARGDGDRGAVLDDNRVKWKHILRLHGQTVWVIHELPYPYPVALWKTGRTLAGGAKDIPDVVVFGHEHCTILERQGGILLVNPGSPTFLNYHEGLGTVGLLEVNSGEAQARIVPL